MIVAVAAGMQPNLTLAYSSQAGRDVYGAGWDLPIGRIERSRRQGVPRYGAGEVFALVLPDGVTELAPIIAPSPILMLSAMPTCPPIIT